MPDTRGERREQRRERLRKKLKLASNRKALWQIEQGMRKQRARRRGRR